MASLKADLFKISKGMGVRNGIELIFLPRVLARLGFKSFYSGSKVAERFISQNLKDVISKYVNVECSNAKTLQTPNIIWIFWWQGEEYMPSVIRECYKSIVRNANGRKVILLTEQNYKNYVQLPSHILNKFSVGKIGYTHFSDVLRVALLIKFGGFWIDAGIFVTKPIPQFQCDFYSPKISNEKHDSPHLHKWVMGVMATPPNMPLFNYIYEMLVSYWQKYDDVFHYLMFDFFIRYGYEHFGWLKELIDDRQIDSPDLHWSRYNFDKEVNKERLDYLLENNTFLSLTYRIPYPMQLENGKETYYSALLKKYS